MQYEKIGLNAIVPTDYNPRIMSESQMLKLTKNMETFGLVDPIIINLKNNHIIGGHQRYQVLFDKYSRTDEGAMHELNLIRLGDIGWVFEDTELRVTDENHEKALNLSLNRLDGEFDDKQTGIILEELSNANFDMDLSGFEDYEIIEYTLDDFQLDLTDDDNSDDNNPSINSIINDDETSMAKIHFNTPEQRSQFIQWIGEIRQKYPENTITEAILAELDHHTPHPITEKVEPYTLLLSCKEEKEKYNELISDIENNPKYKIPPIIAMIQNDKL